MVALTVQKAQQAQQIQQKTWAQFIHGKIPGEPRYQVVAHSGQTEASRIELESLAQRYRFWGQSPPVSQPVAVGVFQYQPDTLLLVQAMSATQANGQPALDVQSRPFTQHRYIFIPRTALNSLAGRLWLLLNWVMETHSTIPLQSQFQPDLPPIPAPDFDSHWFSPVTEQSNLLNALSLTDPQSAPVVLSALAALLNRKRVVFDAADTHNVFSEDLLESILLLLPAAYRQGLSIAAGALDENVCTKASLMVKTNGPPRGTLAADLVWGKRANNQFFGAVESGTLTSHYTDLLRPILQNPTSVKILLRLLDSLSQAELGQSDRLDWAALHNGTLTPRLIPALPDPAERAAYWQTSLRQLDPAGWQKVLPFILDDVGLEIAWERLQAETKRQPAHFAPLVFQLWRNFSQAYITYALEEELTADPALAIALLENGLLTALNSTHRASLYQLCLHTLRWQAERQPTAARHLAERIAHSDHFTQPAERFALREATLPPSLSLAEAQTFFNQQMAPLLPQLSLAEVRATRVQKIFSEQLSPAAESLTTVNQQGLKAWPAPAILAEATAMPFAARVEFYTACLLHWQASYQQGQPWLTDAITQWIAAFPPTDRPPLAEALRPLRAWLTETAPAPLRPVLTDPAHEPTWSDWQAVAEALFDESALSALSFLDHVTAGEPVLHLAQQWLLVCAETPSAQEKFAVSYTWHQLEDDGPAWLAEGLAQLLGWQEASLSALLPVLERVQNALSLPQATLFKFLEARPHHQDDDIGLMLSTFLPQLAVDKSLSVEAISLWQVLQAQAPKVAQLYKVLAEGQRNNVALDIAFDKMHQLKLGAALSEAPEYAPAMAHWLQLVGKGNWLSGRLLETLTDRWLADPDNLDTALLAALLKPDLSEKYNVADWLALASLCWQAEHQALWPATGQPDLNARQQAQALNVAQTCAAEYTQPDHTAALLTACRNWGLSLAQVAEVVSQVPPQACNFSVIQPYLYTEAGLIQPNGPVTQNLIALALQTPPRSEWERTAYQNFLLTLLTEALPAETASLWLASWYTTAADSVQYRQALGQAARHLAAEHFSSLVQRAHHLKRHGATDLSRTLTEALDAYWQEERRHLGRT